MRLLSESQYDYSSWQQILREWRKNRWLWPQTWTCWLTSPLLRKVASRCTRCFKAVQPKSWFAEPREVVLREGCAWMVLGRWVDVDVFFSFLSRCHYCCWLFLGWADNWKHRALVKVTGSSNYVQNTFWQSGNDSKCFFYKKTFLKRKGMACETPTPLHGKCHLKFPFWLLAHLP